MMKLALCIALVVGLILDTSSFSSFTKNKWLFSPLNSPRNRNLMMGMGQHGQDFKYLPMVRGNQDEHFPRIVPIAGIFPDLTYEQLMAPAEVPEMKPGEWVYDFSDADGPQLGTVAVPGSLAITEAFDPVALITTNTALGVQIPEEVEMVVVIDRQDKKFRSGRFFLFKNPDGKMEILWMDKHDPTYEILGRVELVMCPMTEENKKVDTGFLEEE